MNEILLMSIKRQRKFPYFEECYSWSMYNEDDEELSGSGGDYLFDSFEECFRDLKSHLFNEWNDKTHKFNEIKKALIFHSIDLNTFESPTYGLEEPEELLKWKHSEYSFEVIKKDNQVYLKPMGVEEEPSE